MDRHVRDGLVTGHMPLVPSLSLPDEDDRHVLAAAIRSNAEVIITKNLKDFFSAILESYGIEPLHPDDFLLDLFESQKGAFCSALKTVQNRLKNPPKTAEDYLLTLDQQELVRTVERLREFVELI
jgi:hypothetical protein